MTSKVIYSGKYHKHYAISKLWVSYNACGDKQTFYSEDEAKTFSMSGARLEYKGFYISSDFKIFKEDKQVFTAAWQRCETLQQAKSTIDNSILQKQIEDNYTQFQLNKYGNVVAPVESTPDGELFESGIEELNRMADYMNMQSEKELQEKQY